MVRLVAELSNSQLYRHVPGSLAHLTSQTSITSITTDITTLPAYIAPILQAIHVAQLFPFNVAADTQRTVDPADLLHKTHLDQARLEAAGFPATGSACWQGGQPPSGTAPAAVPPSAETPRMARGAVAAQWPGRGLRTASEWSASSQPPACGGNAACTRPADAQQCHCRL